MFDEQGFYIPYFRRQLKKTLVTVGTLMLEILAYQMNKIQLIHVWASLTIALKLKNTAVISQILMVRNAPK